jgi:nucleoside 2-deoxyribosyltransferase
MINPFVYIAAPFFNDAQTRRVETVKEILETKFFRYFSPKDESTFIPGVTPPEEIYHANVHALRKTELLVCITDDKDTGTIFEAGWCASHDTPIIYLWTTAKPGQKFNIMLAASGSVCKSYSQLEDALEDIQHTSAFIRKDWSEEVTDYE